MAKLFTRHDRYHAHALVGGSVLLHFLRRFIQLLRHGTSFPDSESKSLQTVGILLHLLLPTLSLQFSLPEKRNFAAPMIWPELRLHSILFSTRHVVATLISLWNLWPNSLAAEILAKEALVLGTIQLASVISKQVGDPKRRTTNAMPYPDSIDEDSKHAIKSQYARLQFIATSMCIVNDPTMAFWPLLAIQGAALLMTLVRKGFASSLTYHRLYALSLWINYPFYAYRVWREPITAKATFFSAMAVQFTRQLRLLMGFSALECWTLGIMLSIVGWELIGESFLDRIPRGFWLFFSLFNCIPFSFASLIPGGYFKSVKKPKFLS
jgi:hypothetical protein